MNITIPRDLIFHRVKMSTAYIAARNSEPTNCYDRIAATNADDEMLQHFWQDACEEAYACLRSWLLPRPSKDFEGESGGDGLAAYSLDFNATLSLPPYVENIKGPSILTTLQAMMTCSILMRWTGIVDPDSENRYAAETARWRHRLAHLLSFRPHPRPVPLI